MTMLDLTTALSGWEQTEEGLFEKQLTGDGWYATACFVEYGGDAFKLLIETNCAFPREASANLGLFFAQLHTLTYNTYALMPGSLNLSARLLTCIGGENMDSDEFSDFVERCCDDIVMELAMVIPLLQKVAYGGMSPEEALVALGRDPSDGQGSTEEQEVIVH